MAQRHSEYQRLAGDSYWTPAWVYAELLKVANFAGFWDPAPRDFGARIITVAVTTR